MIASDVGGTAELILDEDVERILTVGPGRYRRHIIQRIVNPPLSSKMASCDEASKVCPGRYRRHVIERTGNPRFSS